MLGPRDPCCTHSHDSITPSPKNRLDGDPNAEITKHNRSGAKSLTARNILSQRKLLTAFVKSNFKSALSKVRFSILGHTKSKSRGASTELQHTWAHQIQV